MDFSERRKGKEKCDMVPITDPTLSQEIWRCRYCQTLMYNLDDAGNPAPGAPIPRYGGLEYPELCTVCFGMLSTINNKLYWTSLHNAWKEGFKKP